MVNQGELISNTRKTVPEQLAGNVRSFGPPKLRNKLLVPDSRIKAEIELSESSVRSEFPERTIDFDQNEEAKEALRYLIFIRSSFINRDEDGPRSVSHARRYPYDDEQLEYWRDRMVRALNGV